MINVEIIAVQATAPEMFGSYIESNCYLVIDEKTKDAVFIDIGGEPKRIEKVVNTLQVKPKFILLTHTHFDHVGGVEEISRKYNIPFYVSEIDDEYVQKKTPVFGRIRKADGYLKDGDVLKFGESEIKVIETPGHTKGGLCFLIDNKLFTGDTLFQCSVGRTDFAGGSMSEIIASVKKLAKLDENIEIYPGHGGASTIGYEKMANPYLR